MTEKKLIGKITHYFPKVNAAVVVLDATLKVGDNVVIEGHGSSFEQVISSMQIDRKPIKEGKKGQEIAIAVAQEVKEGYLIFKG